MQATLNGTITVSSGVAGDTPQVKPIFAAALAAVNNLDTEGGTVGTSPVSVTIPNAVANFVFIQNTHATLTLLVTWTPTGGSTGPVLTLEPGGFIMFVEQATGAGISALSLTGSGAGTTYRAIII